MKSTENVKLTMILAIICIALIVSPVAGLPTKGLIQRENKTEIHTITNGQESTGTDYWALIFAVGVYKNHPEKNRESMLEAADGLYDVLIDSAQWQADHIHKVTGSEATGRRLIKEILWLIQNDDSDDISLIYIATHGSPLRGLSGSPLDIPPWDEADNADEILVMYEGFDKWYAFIWDDLLNFFISLLQSEGVCLIVDSCYAGGFNDPPMFARTTWGVYSAASFTQGLLEDVASQGRIVLMSCEEHESCYGSHFSNYLIDGLWGMADLFGNLDGINSAEESFYYAQFWVELLHKFHPTILDLYPKTDPATGELPLTTWI